MHLFLRVAPLSACSSSFSLVQIYQRIGVYFSIATNLVRLSSEPEEPEPELAIALFGRT